MAGYPHIATAAVTPVARAPYPAFGRWCFPTAANILIAAIAPGPVLVNPHMAWRRCYGAGYYNTLTRHHRADAHIQLCITLVGGTQQQACYQGEFGKGVHR